MAAAHESRAVSGLHTGTAAPLCLAILLSAPLLCAAAPPADGDAPVIDGLVNDPAWRTSARTFTLTTPDISAEHVGFAIWYDEHDLYLAGEIDDEQLVHSGNADSEEIDPSREDTVIAIFELVSNASSSVNPRAFRLIVDAGGTWQFDRLTIDSGRARVADASQPALHDQIVVSHSSSDQPDPETAAPARRQPGFSFEARLPWPVVEVDRSAAIPDAMRLCLLNTRVPEQSSQQMTLPSNVPDTNLTNLYDSSRWQLIRMDWFEPMAVRGVVAPLPLYLGADDEHGRWQQYLTAETNPTGPWLNRDRWIQQLDRYQRAGLNTLVLKHPHPFSGFVRLDAFPQACHFDQVDLTRQQTVLTWLLKEAAARDIDIYLGCSRLSLPTGSASQPAGDLDDQSVAYARAATRQLFATFPALAGLVLMSKTEADLGTSSEEIIEAVAAAMNRLADQDKPAAHLPELMVLSDACTPGQMKQIIQRYPRCRVVYPVQANQWFSRQVDSGLARYQHRLAADDASAADNTTVSMIGLGGPAGASSYLLWADPEWLTVFTNNLRSSGVDGFLFHADCAQQSLVEDMFGTITSRPIRPYQPRWWARRLNQHYGTGSHSGQLLQLLQHASSIMPAFVRLIHSQSAHYMPQFGLTFAHYLHMPTVSSHPLDQPGQSHSTTQPAPLTDRQGFNFQTTEHVIDIQASAMLPHPSDAESAIDIARQINTSVLFCKTLLTGLRHCESPTPQQQKALNHLLDHVEMTVLIGEHSANRIDAALAWARLARGEGKVSDCIIPLDRSVETWKKVVEIAAKLYPEPVDYWQSRFVSVPPWSAAQLAESYEHVRGHWSDMLPVFERELNLIRQSLSMNRSQRNLPMWDLLTAEPWANLHSIHRIGFEHSGEADPRYAIHEGTSIVSDPALVLSEGHSLAIDTTDMSDETHLVFETLPSFATLPAGRPLQINFVYRVIDRGQPFNTPFECGIYDKETDTMLGERPRWGAPTGHVAPRVIHVPPLDSDQYRVGFVVHGRAAIVIDLLNIQYIKDF